MASPKFKRRPKLPQERTSLTEGKIIFESYMKGFENEEEKTKRLRDARLAREKRSRGKSH
jgi:hypothetical protein